MGGCISSGTQPCELDLWPCREEHAKFSENERKTRRNCVEFRSSQPGSWLRFDILTERKFGTNGYSSLRFQVFRDKTIHSRGNYGRHDLGEFRRVARPGEIEEIVRDLIHTPSGPRVEIAKSFASPNKTSNNLLEDATRNALIIHASRCTNGKFLLGNSRESEAIRDEHRRTQAYGLEISNGICWYLVVSLLPHRGVSKEPL